MKTILLNNIKNNIYMFRISSDIVPLGSHEINTFPWSLYYKEKLSEIGAFAKFNGIRLSMHPGQYTVINSPSEEIANKAIKDLEYHCKFLDSLNIDYTNKEHGYNYHKKCSASVRNNCSFLEFYTLIDEVISIPLQWKSQKNAFEHVWGYVKEAASKGERNHFEKLMEEENPAKVKDYLEILVYRYNSEYLMDSYFFSQ
ncbi:MAG TPA: DUF1722 domain-containing protein [Clostridiaceae bacterium]